MNSSDDSVSFRPSTAEVVASADCQSDDIYSGLMTWALEDAALIAPTPKPGYPPGNFEPIAVVRCERGSDGFGALTVDAVRLEGDIGAVDAAFSAESRRFPDNVVASCVYSMESPVGLWFVDKDGRAIRPAWPASPCGLQSAPLETLARLTEVSRASHPTGFVGRYMTVCSSPRYATGFGTTTADEVADAVKREQSSDVPTVPALVLPVDDVDALRVCVYPSAGDQLIESREAVTGKQIFLDRSESASLVRSVLDAPIAPACDLMSSRVASTRLERPDGSGHSDVSFELDGCRRALGFGISYKSIPAAVLATLIRT